MNMDTQAQALKEDAIGWYHQLDASLGDLGIACNSRGHSKESLQYMNTSSILVLLMDMLLRYIIKKSL